MPEVGLLGHMTDVVVQELISEASRDTHVVLDTASSSAPGGHIQTAAEITCRVFSFANCGSL